jgi:fatty-acyl-CoA synthase
VNIRLNPEQILYTMNHAQDRWVLVHEDFLPMLEGIAPKLATVEGFVLLSDGAAGRSSLPLRGEYEELLRGAPHTFPFPEFPEEAQATLFYTTGTTGDPKGVFYSHRQLVLHTLATAMAMASFTAQGRFQSTDVYMPITPMFHVHAWGYPYVATLMGAKQVYPGRFDPELILRLIDQEGVTFSHCVPTILHMLLNHPAARGTDLSRWKVMVGGASFPEGLARQALEMGIDAYAAYGMSETCPVLTVCNLKPPMLGWKTEAQIPVRVKTGFPIPLVDLKLVDEQGEAIPRDGQTSGEIVVRAPWLTQGYYGDPVRSEELWRGGWLHTGDVAHQDPEGFVRITDRLKDVIKSGGEWISSLELESLISQHPAVLEVAVIGVAHEKWGERPAALVVPRPGHGEEDLPGGIRAFLDGMAQAGRLSKWAVPDRIEMVQEIPKTSVGKINKRLIRERIAPDPWGPIPPAAP